MTQVFATPSFGSVGETAKHRDLTIGVYGNEIRRVVSLANSSTSAVVSYVRGQILVKNASGVVSALAVEDLVPVEHTLLVPGDVTEVTSEAVGTGNGTLTAFTLAHAPVVAGTLTLNVNDVDTTEGFTLDAHRGVITFDAAVTDTHTVVASYSYADAAEEEEVTLPFLTGCVPLVAEVDVTVPKKVGDVNGSATLNVLVKAELAKDMLYVGSTAWADLDAAVAAKLENWLTYSGLVPADVVR